MNLNILGDYQTGGGFNLLPCGGIIDDRNLVTLMAREVYAVVINTCVSRVFSIIWPSELHQTGVARQPLQNLSF